MEEGCHLLEFPFFVKNILVPCRHPFASYEFPSNNGNAVSHLNKVLSKLRDTAFAWLQGYRVYIGKIDKYWVWPSPPPPTSEEPMHANQIKIWYNICYLEKAIWLPSYVVVLIGRANASIY